MEEKSPDCMAELSAWIEENFDCHQGTPRAFMEAPGSDRIPYVALVVGAKLAKEADLVRYVHMELMGILAKCWFRKGERYKPTLYWRKRPIFQSTQELDWGAGFVKKTAVEDGLATVPNGWMLSDSDDAYRPFVGVYSTATLSMRLALAEHNDLLTQSRIVRPEGMPIPLAF